MNVKLQKKRLLLCLAAALLIAAAAAGTARAYFTTYVTAKGGYTLELGSTTTVSEKFYEWTKHVSVENTGAAPCYVRVRAFAGDRYTLTYGGSAKWAPGTDGYYYYSDILPAGGATEELTIHIGNVPEEEKAAFNVVVVQEYTPVLYRADGTPYADWEAGVDTTVESNTWEGA